MGYFLEFGFNNGNYEDGHRLLQQVRNFYEDSSATSQPRNDSSPTNISNVTTPKGTDLHVNTKLNYDLLSDLWLFPSDATINFSKSNKMCPENCIQQFEDVTFNTSPPASPDEFYIYGVDKIRDTKSTSSDVVAWKYYKMVGWSLVKTGKVWIQVTNIVI